MELLNLYATIGLRDDGFKDGIKDATKNTSGLTSGIKGLVSTVTSIKLVSAAFDMIKGSISGAVERYDTLNRFPIVLQQMGTSSYVAEQSINKLSEGIQGLPTALNEIAANTQSLYLLTNDLDLATDTTLALNDAFLASGSSSADASRGLTQYVQMLSKGQVDLQSWKTLQETMGYALRKTSEALIGAGADSNDLYAALKSGEVTFDEFNAKIVELDGGVGGFAELAKTASAGIATSWTNMKTAIVRGTTGVIESIDTNLAKNSLPNLSQSIELVGGAFEDFLDGIGDISGTIISTAAPAVKLLAGNFDILAPAIIAGVAAFKGYKIIQSFSTATEIAQRTMEKAAFAQELMTLATESNSAAEVVAMAITDKGIATEGVRVAAKQAGLVIDKEGILVTAAGTTATEAQSLAILASSGAISAKTLAVSVLSGNISIATAAQIAWNAAMNANPIGIIIAGVGALTVGLVALSKRTSDVYKEYNASAEDARDGTEDLIDSVYNGIETFDDETKTISANAEATSDLANEVFNLSKVENKTDSQTAELKAKVDMLNESGMGINVTLSETGALLDAETGKMITSKDAILKKVDAYKLEAQTAAERQYYSDILLKEIELNRDIEASTARIVELEKDLNEGRLSESEFQKLRHDELDNIVALRAAYEANATEKEETSDRIVEAYEAEALASESALTTQEEAAVKMAEAFEKAYDGLNETQQNMVDGMIAASTSVVDTVSYMTGSIKAELDMSANDMLEMFQKNNQDTKDYYTNLATLAENGLDTGLLQTLSDKSGESIAIVAQLAKESPEELAKWNEEWGNTAETQVQDYIAALTASGAEIPQAVRDYIKDPTAEKLAEIEPIMEESGTNTGDSYANNVKSALEKGDLGGAFNTVLTNAKNAVDSASPDLEDGGKGNAESYANSLIDNVTPVLKSFGLIIDQLPAKANEKKGEFNTAGQNMSEGVASGINAGKSSVLSAALNMAKSALNAVKNALGIHSPSKKFEEDVGQWIPKGIEQGILKNKKNAKKSAEQMSKEVLSAAEAYLTDYKKAHTVSLADEVYYWQQIVKQTTKGTSARTSADKKYLEAKKKLAAEEKKVKADLVKAEQDYAKNIKKVQDDLVKDIQAVTDAYNASVKSRASAITSSMNLFDEFISTTESTGKSLLSNLESQVMGLETWVANLESLEKRGIDAALIEELQAMGPAASAELAALNSLTDAELTKYVELWKTKTKLATEQATKELSDEKMLAEFDIADLTLVANQQMEDYAAALEKAAKELGKTITVPITSIVSSVETVGSEIVTKITSGIKKASSSKESKTSVNQLTATMMEPFGAISDQSEGFGVNITEGLNRGIAKNKLETEKTMEDLVSAMNTKVTTLLGIHSPSTVYAEIGKNIVDGLWQGMESQREVFYSNVSNFFAGIISQAKMALGIASPSKVMKALGGYTVDGFIIGMEDMADKLNVVMDDIFKPDLSDLSVSASVSGRNAVVASDAQSGNANVNNYFTQNLQSVSRTPHENAVHAKAMMNKMRWAT